MNLFVQSDLVIAAGGDGTILHALAVAAPSGAPVLGVNLGHLGFLAEIEPHELGSALTAIAEGHFHVEDRLALTAQIESSGETRSVWAANDLVMTRAAGNGQADLALGLGGEVFARLAGDGLIVSTPTGSTAYNLSAGGPIVSPAAKALVLTPLANHGMFNRSIVTDAQERVDVRVLNGSAPLTIEHDGVRCWEVGAGAKLSIAKSEISARLIRLGQASFYERARSRLQLADPLELVATNADGATPTLPRRA